MEVVLDENWAITRIAGGQILLTNRGALLGVREARSPRGAWHFRGTVGAGGDSVSVGVGTRFFASGLRDSAAWELREAEAAAPASSDSECEVVAVGRAPKRTKRSHEERDQSRSEPGTEPGAQAGPAGAPRAMRTPISCVRRLTMKEMTP